MDNLGGRLGGKFGRLLGDILTGNTNRPKTRRAISVVSFAFTEEIKTILEQNKAFYLKDEDFIAYAKDRPVYRYKPFNGKCILFREPSNPHDRNAIAVLVGQTMIGYIPREDQDAARGYIGTPIDGRIYSGERKIVEDGIVYREKQEFKVVVYIDGD